MRNRGSSRREMLILEDSSSAKNEIKHIAAKQNALSSYCETADNTISMVVRL
jgi:hypothetical protein